MTRIRREPTQASSGSRLFFLFSIFLLFFFRYFFGCHSFSCFCTSDRFIFSLKFDKLPLSWKRRKKIRSILRALPRLTIKKRKWNRKKKYKKKLKLLANVISRHTYITILLWKINGEKKNEWNNREKKAFLNSMIFRSVEMTLCKFYMRKAWILSTIYLNSRQGNRTPGHLSKC